MDKKQKKAWSIWGGTSGLLVGAWLIFYIKDNIGFIPAILGVLLLLLRRN